MSILLKDGHFDPYAEVRRFTDMHFPMPGAYGATAMFVGTMRDYNEGSVVRGLTLEHYPGMTERHLEVICGEATQRWSLLAALIVHRIGEVQPGEDIVLVAAWSAHRAEAFDACRFMMEDLKSKAPFWKKERLEAGARWVSYNTAGTTELT